MSWMELRVTVPAGLVPTISEQLFALGAAGVQEDYLPGQAPPPRQPWDRGALAPEPKERVLVSWFEQPDPAAIVRSLPNQATTPQWSQVPDTDWETSWRSGFTPIEISSDLTIAPPWCAPPGAVIIEPGQGFGTGLHPSTQAALRLMLPTFTTAQSCLDVGCGSGILAVVAARAGLRCHGVDVEESAVIEARRHAELNGVQATFETTPVDAVPGPWDLVAANLHAELLVALRAPLIQHTGQWLVCAGILADREPLVRAVFDDVLVLDHAERTEDWVALRYRRPQP